MPWRAQAWMTGTDLSLFDGAQSAKSSKCVTASSIRRRGA